MLFPPPSIVLAGLLLPSFSQFVSAGPASSPETGPDGQTLVAAGLATDGPALLDFFRSRTRLESDGERLLVLIRQLNDPAAEVRSRAESALIARGPMAIPALRHAVNDLDDPVRAERARHCLQCIEGAAGAALPAAAARLVALRRPAGAAEVLLAYLPLADDEEVAGAVVEALKALAYPDGKAHPALLAALQDGVAVRRAAAAEALCQKNHLDQRPMIRKLLRDAKPAVQLRTALALAREQDPEAVPVLIDLLAELSPAQRRLAEDVLQDLAGAWAPPRLPTGDDEATRRTRRDAWAAWWQRTDGPALVAEFRKRTLTEGERAKIQDLVRKLSDNSFAVREEATAALVACGAFAVPLLREAVKDSDLERRRRAENCLKAISRGEDRSLPLSAPRLLAMRRPPGALEVLLAFLADAADESMVEEIAAALADLAVREGQPAAALLHALKDPHPARRSAAAVALTRANVAASRPAVRELLADPNPEVRVSVALALTAAGDKDAVAVLLGALTDAPLEQGRKANEALDLLAGEKALAMGLGADAASRQKCRDAWTRWWKEYGSAVDGAKLTAVRRLLGYTLVVESTDTGAGRVLEVGRDGKVRWQIDGLQYPVDAEVLPGNRVLIAEFKGMRVTERDFKGNILWQKQALRGNPTNVQRRADGHTFIATNRDVLEVDRTGKEVFSHGFPDTLLYGAAKTRNGEIFCFLQGGTCIRLDATGKEIKRFPSGRDSQYAGGIDLLPNGRILITQPNQNTVAEVDTEGKTYRVLDAAGVTTATWLSNSHILAASYDNQTIVELDRTGRVVWEYKDGYRPYRARRR